LVSFIRHFFGDECLKFRFKDFAMEKSEQMEETWDVKWRVIVSRASCVLQASAQESHWWDKDDLANVNDRRATRDGDQNQDENVDNVDSESENSNGIGFDEKAGNTQHNCGNTLGPIRGSQPNTVEEITDVVETLSHAAPDSNASTLVSQMKALEVKQYALELERARLQREIDALRSKQAQTKAPAEAGRPELQGSTRTSGMEGDVNARRDG
jgi:hypothetical protein